MFRAQPKSENSKFINAYKSTSSRLLEKEYTKIREKFWKEAFRSQSFWFLTAGGAPVEIILSIMESKVVRIVLYGSVARGTNTTELDVDVALFMNGNLDRDTEDKLSDSVVDMNLKQAELCTL